MIALFDRFARVEIQRDLGVGTEGLLMGVVVQEGAHLSGLVATEDGTITLVNLGSVKMTYRYNPQTDEWDDVNDREPEQVVEPSDQA